MLIVEKTENENWIDLTIALLNPTFAGSMRLVGLKSASN